MGTLRTRLQEMGAALYRRVGGKSSSRSQRPIPRGKRCPLAIPHSQSRTRHSQSRTGDAGGADSPDGQVGIGSTESYKRKETQRFFQPSGRTMNHLEENHEDELSVITHPPVNTGVHTRQWIEYRSTNQISGEPNRLPLHRPEPITRAKPTSTRYWRRMPTKECYGTRNPSRMTRRDGTTTPT